MDEVSIAKIEKFMKDLYNGSTEEDAGSLARKACDEFGLWEEDLFIPESIYEIAYDITAEPEEDFDN